jgi:hypothetical protein
MSLLDLPECPSNPRWNKLEADGHSVHAMHWNNGDGGAMGEAIAFIGASNSEQASAIAFFEKGSFQYVIRRLEKASLPLWVVDGGLPIYLLDPPL